MDWATEFSGSIMICDLDGIILEMNRKAEETYRNDGGRELIGKNVLDCHPEPACSKLRRLLETGEHNVYTIEKKGTKKLVYQAPWFQEGQRRGIIELTFEIPFDLPHFNRDVRVSFQKPARETGKREP